VFKGIIQLPGKATTFCGALHSDRPAVRSEGDTAVGVTDGGAVCVAQFRSCQWGVGKQDGLITVLIATGYTTSSYSSDDKQL
jgi:hypothetical protein